MNVVELTQDNIQDFLDQVPDLKKEDLEDLYVKAKQRDSKVWILVRDGRLEYLRVANELTDNPEAEEMILQEFEHRFTFVPRVQGVQRYTFSRKPANYSSLIESKVYQIISDNNYVYDTSEYMAQEQAARSPDHIYFFWETVVPENWLWVREIIEEAMNDVGGYEVDEFTDEQVDTHTMKIVDEMEKRYR